MQLLSALTIAQTSPADFEAYRLSTGGWLVMLISVGFVSALLVWCMRKVLTKPGEVEKIHSQTDIDPHDADK
ncbi:MAG: hypothetical protein IT441_01345 [Phycisphaeraceae bacterium]|nr:hypothetical protein [Phycisphaeraceae bacterium]